MIAVLLEDLLNGQSAGTVFRQGISGIAVLMAAAIVYAILMVIASDVTGVALSTDSYNSVTNIADTSISLGYRLSRTYRDFLTNLITDPITSYRSNRTGCVNFLIIAIFLIFAAEKWLRIGIVEKMLSLALIALLPFAMNVSCFLNGNAHDLMYYGFWMCSLLTMSVVDVPVEKPSTEKAVSVTSGNVNKVVNYTIIFLICIIVFDNIQVSNTVYVKKENEREATLSLMTRVLYKIEEQEGYVYGETPIAFIGLPLNDESNFSGYENVSVLTGVNYRSPISYQGVYGGYFTYILNYDINICDSATLSSLQEETIVQEMAVFPDDGSVVVVDGIIVVKLSDS